jgi:hypothetical protein
MVTVGSAVCAGVWIVALLVAGLGGVVAMSAAWAGKSPIANTIGAIPLLALGAVGVYVLCSLTWRSIRRPQPR